MDLWVTIIKPDFSLCFTKSVTDVHRIDKGNEEINL